MELRIDTREPAEIRKFVMEAFKGQGITFKEVALQEGDYETDKVLVERKTIMDLYGSMVGNGKGPGRLLAQVERLSLHKDQVVCFLITGSMHEWQENMKKVGVKVNSELIYGQIASLSCRERFHVMWITEEWHALVAMVKFMRKVEEGKYMVPTRRDPDMLTARLLGITPKQWMAMKSKFGTIANISKASDQELSTIYGVGAAKAKRIRELLNNRW